MVDQRYRRDGQRPSVVQLCDNGRTSLLAQGLDLAENRLLRGMGLIALFHRRQPGDQGLYLPVVRQAFIARPGFENLRLARQLSLEGANGLRLSVAQRIRSEKIEL